MKTDCFAALVAAGLLAVAAQAGPVQVIDDRSFFDKIPHTLIDFETRGDGTSFAFSGPGDFTTIHPNEYAPQGVMISATAPPGTLLSPAVSLSPDAEPNRTWFESSASSPNFLIHLARNGEMRLDFPTHVRALGISALSIAAPNSGPVSLLAFDTNDQLIGEVLLGGNLIDGVVLGSSHNLPFDYEIGFFGIHSPSRPIAYALIHEDLASFDGLHFSVVPEPATWVGLALFAAYCARRRPLPHFQA